MLVFLNSKFYVTMIFLLSSFFPPNFSFTLHTGAGLIVPEIQDDGKVIVNSSIIQMLHIVIHKKF